MWGGSIVDLLVFCKKQIWHSLPGGWCRSQRLGLEVKGLNERSQQHAAVLALRCFDFDRWVNTIVVCGNGRCSLTKLLLPTIFLRVRRRGRRTKTNDGYIDNDGWLSVLGRFLRNLFRQILPFQVFGNMDINKRRPVSM